MQVAPPVAGGVPAAVTTARKCRPSMQVTCLAHSDAGAWQVPPVHTSCTPPEAQQVGPDAEQVSPAATHLRRERDGRRGDTGWPAGPAAALQASRLAVSTAPRHRASMQVILLRRRRLAGAVSAHELHAI